MSDDARIGRVLVASLHQAIGDVLPDRLEFYENWLTVPGLREGTIGLAPLSAVLSFLRLEGEAYHRTTARAGEYAAEWTVSNMSAFERRLIGALPAVLQGARGVPDGASAGALDVSRIARQGEAPARHGIDRLARLALLRDPGGDRDAALRVLRRGDCARAQPVLARGPCRGARMPRGDARQGLPAQRGGARRERRPVGGGSMTRITATPLIALALSLAAASGAVPASAQGPGAAADQPRVLVVPFENERNEPKFHWLSEAAAVLLTDGLRAGGSAAIVRSQRVRAFEQLYLPVSRSLSRATIIKVGQLVGATDVVIGTYRVDGTTLSVTARSIRLDAGRLQPEVTERGELTELFGIFERLSGRLGRGGRPAGPAAAHPPLDAFENYIKGLLATSPVSQASFLEAALRDAPAFDRARLALWEVRTEQADHAGALETVRAVAPTSPRAFHAQFFAGISLIELKRYDEALGVLRALQESPAAAPNALAAVLNNLGVLVLRRGATPQTGSAAYHLTKATDARSRSGFHVQPRVRVRVGPQLPGRALLVAGSPAARSG